MHREPDLGTLSSRRRFIGVHFGPLSLGVFNVTFFGGIYKDEGHAAKALLQSAGVKIHTMRRFTTTKLNDK